MSVPSQFGPPPPSSSGGGGRVVVVVVLIVLVLMMACCGALSAGIVFAYRHVETAILESSPVQRAREAMQLPPVLLEAPQQQWIDDWMINRALAPVYTTALDTVTTDKKLIERLGDPVEAVLKEDTQMFRRKNSGEVNASEETIEFDIQGPKGAATVVVVASSPTEPPQAAPAAFSGELRVAKISVTLTDGSVIEVPPPKEQPAFVPVR